MNKLKEILLIDDSRGTNILNKRIMEEMNIAYKITTLNNGKAALEYLTNMNNEGGYPDPELIFLDINMPVMDGYQFLEKYAEEQHTNSSLKPIIMLSSSANEVDLVRSQLYSMVKGYQSKPLTQEKIIAAIDLILK